MEPTDRLPPATTRFADVRIQLEGHVENVEAAIAVWEQSGRALRGTSWQSGQPFLGLVLDDSGVKTSIAALQRRADVAPELTKLEERLRAAKELVRARGSARLEQTGMRLAPSATLAEVLEELRNNNTLLYDESPGWSIAFGICLGPWALTALGAAAAISNYREGLDSWKLAVGAFVFACVSCVATLLLTSSAPRIRLTPRKLLIGSYAVELAQLVEVASRCVNFPDGDGGNNGSWMLTIASKDQPLHARELATDPYRLLLLLQGLRIQTVSS